MKPGAIAYSYVVNYTLRMALGMRDMVYTSPIVVY